MEFLLYLICDQQIKYNKNHIIILSFFFIFIVTLAINRIPIIANKINAEKYKDSQKYKTIILGDAIYATKILLAKF